MSNHDKLDYVEFPASDFNTTKLFFENVFGWIFTDYGKNYTAFSNAGIEGGFYKSELRSEADTGATLMIFYSDDLNATLDKVVQHGGVIIKPVFDFPGGSRFHFSDPNGNEFAVWTKI